MTHPTTSVMNRSFWFGVGAFRSVTEDRTAQECLGRAEAARVTARTSQYPLRCLAQAAWWAAAAERCPVAASPAVFLSPGWSSVSAPGV